MKNNPAAPIALTIVGWVSTALGLAQLAHQVKVVPQEWLMPTLAVSFAVLAIGAFWLARRD